jgi:heterodisulfide reductase subunit C/quinone-modifying oxidoreductase subunit QmoC
MAVAVPMLVVEVPFGKWSHLVYRPLAVYFQSIKDKAIELQNGGTKHG